MNPARRQRRARSPRPARRRGALSRVVAAAGVMLLVGGCSAFFDDSGLRDGDEDSGASGSGGQGGGGKGGGGAGGVGGSGGASGKSGNDGGGGASGFGGGLPDSIYEVVIQGDDPLAYYRFSEGDEGSSPSLIEGAPAAEFVGIEVVPPGAVGSPRDGALRLDGSSFATIDSSLGLRVNGGFTIELWFSLEAALIQDACLVSLGNEGFGGFLIEAALNLTGGASRVTASIFDADGEGADADVILSSLPFTFTYLAASFDGSALTLCVGEFGSSLRCRSDEVGVSLLPIDVAEISVGDSIENGGCGTVGLIDELAIYQVPLGEGTLRGHFTASRGLPFDPSDPPF